MQRSDGQFPIPFLTCSHKANAPPGVGITRKLWGGKFCTDGYFAGTVGRHGNEETIGEYVKRQGRAQALYKKLHEDHKLALF
ncbi:hypothetical protein F7P81_11445 [Pseudochrobactrum saccharolyticum]|uniref:transposase n=1 Tax=Pseudochrobactrum saccharolyticum TaxID=354352 RepID=UPI0012467741|nr:hypothetical protein F7P81_11445 [Pseudochrobactrum saccharolyticum]